MQSGTANVPWAFQPDPAEAANSVGRRLGLSWTSSQDLINQLRSLSWTTLMSAQQGIMDMVAPRGFRPFPFVPNVEPTNSPETRFLTDTPVNIMARGQVINVPMIIGFNSVSLSSFLSILITLKMLQFQDEALYMIRESILDKTVFDQFAANQHFFVPTSYNLNPINHAAQVNEVATTFRNMYFNGQNPHSGIIYNWTQYNTDHQFSYFVDRTVRFHVRRQTQPIYYYTFSYDGALNMLKRLILLGDVSLLCHSF